MDRRRLDVIARELGTTRSRRQVLGTAAKGTIGGVGAALVARGPGQSLGDSRVNAQAAVCAPPPQVLERRNINDLDDEELASLRRGVAEMKRRSVVNPDDETGWLYQANLHGMPATTSQPTWCQHASWFFFPWHRMYLYRFERILQQASGDADLRLPYWNYSDDPEHRAVPRALGAEFDAAGNPNPLYEARRAPGMNNGTVPLSDTAVAYTNAFNQIAFFSDQDGVTSFGGRLQLGPANSGPGFGELESAPHGGVHVEVGGNEGRFRQVFSSLATISYHDGLHAGMSGTIAVVDPPVAGPTARTIQIGDGGFFPENLTIRAGSTVNWYNVGDKDHQITADDDSFSSPTIIPNGYMRLPPIAGRDPVFWLHHANIDRLWEQWLAQEGCFNPTERPEWMDQIFPFYDIDGTIVHMAVRDVLDTTCLGYRYGEPPTEAEREAPVEISATPVAVATRERKRLGESPGAEPIEIGAEPVAVAVELAPAAAADLARVATIAATPVAGAEVPGLTMTLEGIQDIADPGLTYGVYVNLPPGVEPDPNSEYFVGTIYLFGLSFHGEDEGHAMAEQGGRQTFDITRAVQASRARADAPEGVTVTIDPSGAGRIIDRMATPVADDGQQLTRGPWVTVERVTVTAIE